MDLRTIYDEKERDPKYFPLFQAVWEVLNLAPSSKHAQEGELIDLTWDAFDYLQADGKWFTASETGKTELFWKEHQLTVKERDNDDFTFERSYNIH